MTKKQIDNEIKNIEPTIGYSKSDIKTRWAYRLLLTFPTVGPFTSEDDVVEKAKKFWRFKDKDCETMIRRACRNRIVKYGTRNQNRYLCDTTYGDNLGIILGATIMLGFIKRVKP